MAVISRETMSTNRHGIAYQLGWIIGRLGRTIHLGGVLVRLLLKPRSTVAAWRAAADRGDARAAFRMSQACRLGLGTPRDPVAEREWSSRAILLEAAHYPSCQSVPPSRDNGLPPESGAALE
jgi:hypothetical protein